MSLLILKTLKSTETGAAAWSMLNFRLGNCLPGITSRTLNMSRIDRIYAPKDMISDAFGYTFHPCSYSDHDLVSLNFQCKQTAPHGPGLWKFNSSLTQDDDYTGLLSQFLQDWKLQKGRYPDLQTWWDAGKCHIRDITVELSTLKWREKRSQRSNLV